MKKRYLLLFAVFLLAFGALFALLSTAPDQQRGRDFLEISVITREADSLVWASIRQGMEQAAKDLDVELRLVTLSETNYIQEQQLLLVREAQGGADALILSPADPDAMLQSATEAELPIILVSTPMGTLPCISADNEAMGRSIALEMLPRLSAGSRVVLLSIAPGKGAVAARERGAIEVLRGAGATVERLYLPGARAAAAEAISALLQRPPALIIALEPVALEAVARAAQGLTADPLLCGIGSTNLIVSHLERGAIQAVAAQNDFAMGYLAIEAAVNAATNRPVDSDKEIGFSIVRQDTMYLPENQKLLFPFVR